MEVGLERRNGHTQLSGLLLAWVFVMSREKSKSGKEGLVFGPLVTEEENSERNLHDRSFG